ncbi:MAG: OmpA family protein [Spirochaetota bacterium]
MRRGVAASCMIVLAVLMSLAFILSGCATSKEAAVEDPVAGEEPAPEEQATAEAARGEEPDPEPDRDPEVVRVVRDSDGDGVPDHLDQCPDTPPGVRVDEKGCPVAEKEEAEKEEKEAFTYQVTLLFDLDSAVLRREYVELRNEAVAFMEENPGAELESVLIEGHTDSTGTDAYNVKLSRARADPGPFPGL